MMENQNLLKYISQKLDQMMIEYNSGFLLSLSLEEKYNLKDIIDKIAFNFKQQIKNQQNLSRQNEENGLIIIKKTVSEMKKS